MKVADETVHKREITAVFSEDDLWSILTQKLAKDCEFIIDPRNTMISMIFKSEDISMPCDPAAVVHTIEVTMRNDLS